MFVYDVYLDVPSIDVEVVKAKLSAKDFSFVVRRDIPGQEGQYSLYFVAQTNVPRNVYYVELKFKNGMNICKVTVKSENKSLSDLAKSAVGKILVQ